MLGTKQNCIGQGKAQYKNGNMQGISCHIISANMIKRFFLNQDKVMIQGYKRKKKKEIIKKTDPGLYFRISPHPLVITFFQVSIIFTFIHELLIKCIQQIKMKVEGVQNCRILYVHT